MESSVHVRSGKPRRWPQNEPSSFAPQAALNFHIQDVAERESEFLAALKKRKNRVLQDVSIP
jgi:hypothetical protein